MCNVLIQSMEKYYKEQKDNLELQLEGKWITIEEELEKIKISLTGICKKMVLPNDGFDAVNANFAAVHESFKVCLLFFCCIFK